MSRILNQAHVDETRDFLPAYPNEAAVQQDGNRYLRENGWIVRVFATDKRKRKQEVGWFDTVAIKDGWILFIEYKAPGGELRVEQLQLHEEMRPHLGDRAKIVVAEHPLLVLVAAIECRG